MVSNNCNISFPSCYSNPILLKFFRVHQRIHQINTQPYYNTSQQQHSAFPPLPFFLRNLFPAPAKQQPNQSKTDQQNCQHHNIQHGYNLSFLLSLKYKAYYIGYAVKFVLTTPAAPLRLHKNGRKKSSKPFSDSLLV